MKILEKRYSFKDIDELEETVKNKPVKYKITRLEMAKDSLLKHVRRKRLEVLYFRHFLFISIEILLYLTHAKFKKDSNLVCVFIALYSEKGMKTFLDMQFW